MRTILVLVAVGPVVARRPPPTRVVSRSGRRRLRRARLRVHERRADARGEDSLPHRRHAAEGRRRRRAQRRADPARHGRHRRGIPGRGLRRAPVRQGAAARRREVLHHPAGQRRSRPVEQAERRPAHEVSEVSLHRHGEAAVRARDQGAGPDQSQARDGHLDGRDARVELGLHVSGLRGGPRAAGQQSGRDRRPQPRVAQVPDRRDRNRSDVEERRTTPSSRAGWPARSDS